MLVIGGDGTLGQAMVAKVNSDAPPVWHTSRRGQNPGQHGFQLDLSDPSCQWQLPQQQLFLILQESHSPLNLRIKIYLLNLTYLVNLQFLMYTL